MHYKQVKIDFLLNKIVKKDTLFYGDYTIDPYQKCEFGCLYCDSSFDETIYIKINAAKILKKELENAKRGTIIVGSVHDPYQKAEEKYKITRDLLKIIKQKGFSCHILTKSNLVIRDLDIISNINHCIITISITSLKGIITRIFEKKVPSPKIRLKTIEKLANHDIKTGLALIPIFPYIVENELEEIIKAAKNHKAQYLLHKLLELKGDQKTYFINILKESYPDLINKYEKLYEESYVPNSEYISKINYTIKKLCNKYKLKHKI